VQVAHGVTSALKDLGHAGADIGNAVAHGVTGSLTDMGHAMENVGRSFESEETRARHDAHHNERIDQKYDGKIAHDEYVDERNDERKEARREHHIEHLKEKCAEPYKSTGAEHEAQRKNADLKRKEAHKVDKKHAKQVHREQSAQAKKERKQRCRARAGRERVPTFPGPRIHPHDPTRLRIRDTPGDQPCELLPLGRLRRRPRQPMNHSNSGISSVLQRWLESALTFSVVRRMRICGCTPVVSETVTLWSLP